MSDPASRLLSIILLMQTRPSVKNCAYCDDYICEELGKFFKIAPEGKATLDRIREGL